MDEPSAGRIPESGFHLADLSWTELRERLAAREIVAILPIGALEAHGPHLPLDTDRCIAEAMAVAGAEELLRQGLEAFVLPAVVYTPAPFAAAFPGTANLPGGVLRATIEGILQSCDEWGVDRVVLANAHQDPAHVTVLRDLAARSGSPEVVFPDLTRRRWASFLAEDFRRGCHAGSWETAILMAVEPERVREVERRALPASPVSILDAIAAGHRDFASAGAAGAWVGDPAAATAEHGAEQVTLLGEIVARAVAESRGDETLEEIRRSPT